MIFAKIKGKIKIIKEFSDVFVKYFQVVKHELSDVLIPDVNKIGMYMNTIEYITNLYFFLVLKNRIH